MDAAELALADLQLRLARVQCALRRAIATRAARAERLQTDRAPKLYLTEQAATALVDEVARTEPDTDAWRPTAEERAERRILQDSATSALPFDRLALHGIDELEAFWLAVCAAPEFDTAYERVYGYVVDDLSRGAPSVDLLLSLVGDAPERRAALGPYGTLRRCRILAAGPPAASERRRELRPVGGLVDYLAGAVPEPPATIGDPYAVRTLAEAPVPPGVDERRLRRVAAALHAGDVGAAAIWGRDDAMRERAVLALADGAALRRLPVDEALAQRADPAAIAAAALDAAAATGAMLWVETDALGAEDAERQAVVVAHVLARTRVALLLSGRQPWRPRPLLRAHAYVELELEAPSWEERRTMWRSLAPELDRRTTADLAARYRVGASEVEAAVAMARVESAVVSNGRVFAELVGDSCATVARRRSYRFATVVRPQRKPADLVLPEALHEQVLEVASFFREWPRIHAAWGSVRLGAGPGLRVLFTGEPGTGKTLAAEVIAGLLRLDLLKVDLGRVVSKWVGETERNLDAAFEEAEDSASVLMFDEADSLFAKRGEIRHGTDRYSNLEVGFLLQRLEQSSGLVVLATNLRENLDEAFTRRFNTILHFPRPGSDERRRIWDQALPPEVTSCVDLDTLSTLDLTGAGIVAIAQTAALLAAEEGDVPIEMRHAVRATARQFRREGRVLAPSQLAEHASLLR
jgi:ATPase family associated with various cellular activities (AAA)/Winged helix domain, variant